ncbi:MAG: hypothetical protein AA908_10190 [Chlorobi bacterium NICIL-2]|nr:MAG: hypothetical protein AA908_10190 [Chlorobi bacterium NICIL-2]
MSNAMQIIKECADAGDQVVWLFDGAGVTWPSKLAQADHPLHKLYDSVKQHVTGACAFCSRAFQVESQNQQAGIPLLDEFRGHPSIRSLVSQGYEIITL